jgi:hypothetical protein
LSLEGTLLCLFFIQPFLLPQICMGFRRSFMEFRWVEGSSHPTLTARPWLYITTSPLDGGRTSPLRLYHFTSAPTSSVDLLTLLLERAFCWWLLKHNYSTHNFSLTPHNYSMYKFFFPSDPTLMIQGRLKHESPC